VPHIPCDWSQKFHGTHSVRKEDSGSTTVTQFLRSEESGCLGRMPAGDFAALVYHGSAVFLWYRAGLARPLRLGLVTLCSWLRPVAW